MTESDPEAWGCAVCGRILEETLDKGEVIAWAHPFDLAPSEDHPPVPVHISEIPEQLLMRCDFCLAEPPTHSLKSVETSMPAVGVLYNDEWAVCETCAAFIEADDWLGLRRRAFAEYRRLHGEMNEEVAVMMRVVYRDLRAGMRSFTRD